MEIFRGYVSFGGHGAADNLPRIDELKLRLTELYQPGARNIYFEEAASRKFSVLQRAQQIYAAQPAENRSVFVATQQALGHDEQSIQRSRDILTKYRLALARIGPNQLRDLMYRTNSQLEQARIFTLAEYEMLDSLPSDFNLEFTSEAFTPKELNKLKASVDRSEQFNLLLVNSLMRGDTNAAQTFVEKEIEASSAEMRLRNSRVVNTWNEYRDQAVRLSRPTRLGSRFGSGHASLRGRLPTDEWTFEFDFDPLLSPGTRLTIACELDPKRRPTQEEVLAILLEHVTDARFVLIKATVAERLVFLQQLLQVTTSNEIRELIIKQADSGIIPTFDSFVRERDLTLPNS